LTGASSRRGQPLCPRAHSSRKPGRGRAGPWSSSTRHRPPVGEFEVDDADGTDPEGSCQGAWDARVRRTCVHQEAQPDLSALRASELRLRVHFTHPGPSWHLPVRRPSSYTYFPPSSEVTSWIPPVRRLGGPSPGGRISALWCVERGQCTNRPRRHAGDGRGSRTLRGDEKRDFAHGVSVDGGGRL